MFLGNSPHDKKNIEYCICGEEVFGSGINPSIKHCFLAYMKTKTKSVSIVEHHYVQKHLILQQYLQKCIDTDG